MCKIELFSILGTVVLVVVMILSYNVWNDNRKAQLYRECWENTLKLENLQKEIGSNTAKIVGCYRT